MRLPLPRFLAFLALPLAACAAPELVWETDGFSGPESIVHDHQRNVYYVSNMGTWGEGETPDDGFLSRVASDGSILELRWITGLKNPKGLAIANDRLYVGDDHGMIEVDLRQDKITAVHAPTEGAAGFNDCTADPDGNIFVFSSPQKTIFRLHQSKFEPWFEVDTGVTGGLNGLRAEAERLLMGGWSVRDADGNEQLGHISTVRYADKKLARIGTTPVAHTDGIEPDGFGGYTVTDWLTGDVKHVSPDGDVTLIMQLVQGTADHEYIIDQKLLLIPLMKDDVVRAYRWSATE